MHWGGLFHSWAVCWCSAATAYIQRRMEFDPSTAHQSNRGLAYRGLLEQLCQY